MHIERRVNHFHEFGSPLSLGGKLNIFSCCFIPYVSAKSDKLQSHFTGSILIFTQGFNIRQYFCLSLAGAVREIQIRVPEIVQLYCLGSTSNVVHSAVNLDKKLEESSSGLPETNHSKSMAGKLNSTVYFPE